MINRGLNCEISNISGIKINYETIVQSFKYEIGGS